MVGWLGRGRVYVGSRGVRGGEGSEDQDPSSCSCTARSGAFPSLSFFPPSPHYSFINSFISSFLLLVVLLRAAPSVHCISSSYRVRSQCVIHFSLPVLFYYIHSNSLQLRIQTPTNTHPLPTVKLLAILPWFTFASGVLTAIATSAYRVVMVFTSIGVSFALGLVPKIGPVASFVFICWIDA